jgi:cell division septation protein DedD
VSDELAGHSTKIRMPRAGGMDPATKRLALIAAGLGGMLLVVLGAWSTLGGHHGGGVPVVAASEAPLRVKPDNPGGLKVGTDSILSSRLNDAAGDKLAPNPEMPDPQALKAPTASPSVAQPAPEPPSTPPPEKAAAPMPSAAPAAPAPAPHAEAKPAPASHPAAAAARGALQVQLAALPTRHEAEVQWRTLLHREAHLLAGRTPTFNEATANGRTWWRVRTGGFADETQARAFCEKLRAAGGACSVARF